MSKSKMAAEDVHSGDVSTIFSSHQSSIYEPQKEGEEGDDLNVSFCLVL